MTTLLFVLLAITLPEQDAGIRGTVLDPDNGKPVPGVELSILGSDLSVTTDINGYFDFGELKPGSYALFAMKDGYDPETLERINAVAGEVTDLEIRLKSLASAYDEEVVVTGIFRRNSEVGLLQHRQHSNSISDALSYEEMGKIGGGSAADVVVKITSASVVDGKYVFIRGLGDRYTSTHLNGTELPTADPDVKAFQADLFPSNILDNIVTVKSFTPDKPGNFSGGIIDISTKSYPSEFTFNVSVSGSGNSETTGNSDYLYYPGSGSDWMGSDDGLRDLPDILDGGNVEPPDVFRARSDESQARLLDEISNSFEPVMAPSTKSGPVNESFAISVGGQKNLFGRRFGYLASLSYGRKHKFLDNRRMARWKLTSSPGEADSLINQSDFIGDQGTDNVIWGGLISTNLTLHESHEISGVYLYTQGGTSRSQFYEGRWPEQFSSDNAYLQSRVLKYTERNLNSTQITGKHLFGDEVVIDLNWTAAFSNTSQDEPDTRIFTNNYSDRVIGGEETRIYSIAPSIYSNPARYFRDLNEDATTFSANLSFLWPHASGESIELKVGGLHNKKEREFNELRYEYASGGNIRFDGNPEEFFGPESVGIVGFNETRGIYEFGNVIQLSPDARGGNYFGDFDITAFYAMLDLPINERLKFVAGARSEQANMFVSNETSVGELDDSDILPSFSAIYRLDSNQNFRFSYGRTLARPTFREKAPYSSFDFLADGIFAGNPDLKRTLIDNYDFRWEWFPRAGEIAAVSVFYKGFENPIERSYNIRFSSEFGEKTFQNVDAATVYGLELELRKKLGWVFRHSDSHSLSVAMNLSLIESIVDIPEEELAFLLDRDPDADTERTLQGQSPILANVGFNYDNFNAGTAASIYYNFTGERLDEVGLGGAPDSLETERDTLDFMFSQRIRNSISFKFNLKNITDSPVEIEQTFKGQSFLRSYYETGRSYSLSLSFKPE